MTMLDGPGFFLSKLFYVRHNPCAFYEKPVFEHEITHKNNIL